MKRFAMMMAMAACAVVLCAGLAACGSGGSSSGSAASGASASASAASASAAASGATASAASATSAAGSASQPVAGVNPADIDPGQVTGESDIWRLDGNASAEGIRFEASGNEAGLSFIRVSADGEDGDGEFNLVITDEQHLRTPLGTAPKIDIVFTDAMNCYDCVSGNWYRRG